MILPRLVRSAVAWAALILALSVGAAPAWHTLQAPHCLIVSQLGERATRDWATQFEQFTAAVRSQLRVEEAYLPPLTVVLFADAGKFAPYAPRDSKGRKRDVAGFFASRDTWGVISLAEGFGDDDTRHVVLHEATHWLVSATSTELPLWLNEGFAEVFSTFLAKKDHGLLGEPLPWHLAALRQQNWVPLIQILLTSNGESLYTDSNRNPIYYAQAWALTHQILFENPQAGAKTLNQFFVARRAGTDQLTALQNASGKDLATLEKDLERYCRGGRFTYTKLPFPAEAKIVAPFVPATPSTIELALARVALGAQRLELARQHVDRALALDVAAPAGHELLAVLERQAENNAAAVAAAQAALDHGSHDAWMHLLVANALWNRSNDRGELTEKSRELADHYAAAISAQPKLRSAYCAYARLAKRLPKTTQADADLLVSGIQRHPDAAELLVGLAVVLHKGRNDKEAFHVLDLALRRGDQLAPEQRAAAERLRDEWKIAPLAQQLDEFDQNGHHEEALALCEQILQERMHFQERKRWENRRSELQFRVALAAASRADGSEERAAAISRLEQLLADADLPPYRRKTMQETIDRLKRLAATEPPQP